MNSVASLGLVPAPVKDIGHLDRDLLLKQFPSFILLVYPEVEVKLVSFLLIIDKSVHMPSFPRFTDIFFTKIIYDIRYSRTYLNNYD